MGTLRLRFADCAKDGKIGYWVGLHPALKRSLGAANSYPRGLGNVMIPV